MLTIFKKLSIFKKLIALFMGAVLFMGAIIFGWLGATTASAVPYTTASYATGMFFSGGAGHSGRVWAGTWNNGARGFCLDFGKATPNRKRVDVSTKDIPGMTAEESKQAKFIANKYDNNGSNDAAANAGIAIWRLQHDANFNTWYADARAKSPKVITATRHADIDTILADAAQHAPYKMSFGENEVKVQVGQTGTGTIKLLGSNGKPAVGRPVTVTSKQGKILTVNGVGGNKGTSRSTGLVFTYQRNTTGRISFQASLTFDSSSTAGITLSQAGHQRTLSGVDTETFGVDYGYDLTPGLVEIANACDTSCGGVSKVTFKVTNHSGVQAIKWTEKWTDKAGAKVQVVVSAKPGKSDTAVRSLPDGTAITSSYCYTGPVLGGGCTTPEVGVPGYEVLCPAWAQGEIKLPCNCTPDLPGSVTLTSPADSHRFYSGFVTINKGTPTQVNLVNGKPSTISTGKLAADTRVVVSFKVYRDAARTVQMGGSHVLDDITVK